MTKVERVDRLFKKLRSESQYRLNFRIELVYHLEDNPVAFYELEKLLDGIERRRQEMMERLVRIEDDEDDKAMG